MSCTTVAASLIAVTQIFAPAALAESPEAARAREQLEPYRQLTEIPGAGRSFRRRACMKGKSIISIPASSAIRSSRRSTNSMRRSPGEIGFKLHVWENQGQVTQWVQGFDYAIDNKFNLIDLLAGSDPRFLEPQVKAARDAGAHGRRRPSHRLRAADPRRRDGVVPIDYKRAGGLLADWAIWKTDGKANASVMGANDVLSTDSMFSGIKEEFAKCPNCKCEHHQRLDPRNGGQDPEHGAGRADRGSEYRLYDPDL